jgi:hypothetical protein
VQLLLLPCPACVWHGRYIMLLLQLALLPTSWLHGGWSDQRFLLLLLLPALLQQRTLLG